ncbi:XRE family transcriptional regulator [Amycolatopsis sp. WAC 01416]|nr:XRE family transcriptional regulator [Amycolatopsis sp. WAC 01416]
MTQVELAASSGVSTATLREMQNARIARRRSSRTLAAISTALQWPADHLEHLAMNGENPSQPTDPLVALAERVDELAQRLESLERRLP